MDISKVQAIVGAMWRASGLRIPEFVEKVSDLRGKAILILALSTRFGREARPHDQMTRVVVWSRLGR